MSYHTPLGEFESTDAMVAEILRRKSPQERLEMEKSQRRSVIETLSAYLKNEHSHWSPQQIATEICRRIPNGEELEWREFLRDEDCKEDSSLNK